MLKLDSIPVNREVPNTLNQAPQILFDLDPPYFFLAVPIDLCNYILLTLHKRLLDFSPIGLPE
jgi:hypothetical protein